MQRRRKKMFWSNDSYDVPLEDPGRVVRRAPRPKSGGRGTPGVPVSALDMHFLFQVIILNKYVWILVPEIWIRCRELLAIKIIGSLVSWTSSFGNFFCFVSLTLFSTKRETSLTYWHMVPSIFNKINNSFTPWLNPALLRCHNRFSQSAKGKTYKW